MAYHRIAENAAIPAATTAANQALNIETADVLWVVARFRYAGGTTVVVGDYDVYQSIVTPAGFTNIAGGLPAVRSNKYISGTDGVFLYQLDVAGVERISFSPRNSHATAACTAWVDVYTGT